MEDQRYIKLYRSRLRADGGQDDCPHKSPLFAAVW